MTPAEAARILGLGVASSWDDVRQAYRDQIRTHHPDRAGEASSDRATVIIEAYRVLAEFHQDGEAFDAAAARGVGVAGGASWWLRCSRAGGIAAAPSSSSVARPSIAE